MFIILYKLYSIIIDSIIIVLSSLGGINTVSNPIQIIINIFKKIIKKIRKLH
jgi:hypothetical protein